MMSQKMLWRFLFQDLRNHRLTASITMKKREQRLTFPFPFVHHQSHDWKVEQLLTLGSDLTFQSYDVDVKEK